MLPLHRLRKLKDKFQENLLRPGIIDARAWYRAVARRLRKTGIEVKILNIETVFCTQIFGSPSRTVLSYPEY
jgi:hypothetical protein